MEEENKAEHLKIGEDPKIPLPIPIKIVEGGTTDNKAKSTDGSGGTTDRMKNLVNKGGKTLAPNTTEEQDVTTAGQRAINLIWENTQSAIALLVIRAGIYINGGVVLLILVSQIFKGLDLSSTTVAVIAVSTGFINMIAGIVIGFYFSRTNHSKIGGIGPKEGER